MARHSDVPWPFAVAWEVMTRRRRTLGRVLIAIGAFIALMAFIYSILASIASGFGVSVSEAVLGGLIIGLFSTLIFGLPLIVIGYLILRSARIPRGLLPIGGWGGKKYFIGDDGIYENRSLLIPWSDVDDVSVIMEHTRRYRVRPVISLSLTQEYEVDEIKEGVIRVYLRDGRTIDVPYVIYPTQVVEYVRRRYLGKQ